MKCGARIPLWRTVDDNNHNVTVTPQTKFLLSSSSKTFNLFFLRSNPLPCSGNIISCNGFTKYDGSFHEDYCWTQGLYTIREAYHYSLQSVPYPGIIPEDIPLCLGMWPFLGFPSSFLSYLTYFPLNYQTKSCLP